MPVMEIDVAGSIEQNGYFCAVPLTQTNSWLCAPTTTEEFPAWFKIQASLAQEKCCVGYCDALIRLSRPINWF